MNWLSKTNALTKWPIAHVECLERIHQTVTIFKSNSSRESPRRALRKTPNETKVPSETDQIHVNEPSKRPIPIPSAVWASRPVGPIPTINKRLEKILEIFWHSLQINKTFEMAVYIIRMMIIIFTIIIMFIFIVTMTRNMRTGSKTMKARAGRKCGENDDGDVDGCCLMVDGWWRCRQWAKAATITKRWLCQSRSNRLDALIFTISKITIKCFVLEPHSAKCRAHTGCLAGPFQSQHTHNRHIHLVDCVAIDGNSPRCFCSGCGFSFASGSGRNEMHPFNLTICHSFECYFIVIRY